MSLKLTEKSRVKTLANIGKADALFDDIIDGMIEQASYEVEQLCHRQFTSMARTEFYTSYDMSVWDPVPIYAMLRSFPVDLTQPFIVIYSPYERHDQIGITLAIDTDYKVIPDIGQVMLRSITGGVAQLSLLGLTNKIFLYAPNGFRITYTGGYPLQTNVSSPADPLDETIVQVPLGLRSVIARKCADDWKNNKALTPWTDKQIQALYPWRRN